MREYVSRGSEEYSRMRRLQCDRESRTRTGSQPSEESRFLRLELHFTPQISIQREKSFSIDEKRRESSE